MSQKKEWKKSLENKIEKRKEFIKNVKELTNLAAEADERNKEDEAKLFFVEHMPESILVERGYPLFLFEKHDEEQLNRYLPCDAESGDVRLIGRWEKDDSRDTERNVVLTFVFLNVKETLCHLLRRSVNLFLD